MRKPLNLIQVCYVRRTHMGWFIANLCKSTLYLLGDDDNDTVQDLVALKVITQALVKNDVLPFIYEKYEVWC